MSSLKWKRTETLSKPSPSVPHVQTHAHTHTETTRHFYQRTLRAYGNFDARANFNELPVSGPDKVVFCSRVHGMLLPAVSVCSLFGFLLLGGDGGRTESEMEF